MAGNRGFYSTGSKTRQKLIEAAADLLAEEGYQAISARRVAAHAGLKPQLVHYYFRSMEELIVTVFERDTANYNRLHIEALASANPLRALWKLNSNLPQAQLMFEFVALSNQHEGLRERMRETGEDFRVKQIDAIQRIFELRGSPDPGITAEALAMLMSSIARSMVIENRVGVETGHNEMVALVEYVLDRIDPLVPESEGAEMTRVEG